MRVLIFKYCGFVIENWLLFLHSSKKYSFSSFLQGLLLDSQVKIANKL